MTLLLALALGCNQDISVTETAKCDGVLQSSEDWVDSPFDKDEDNYADGGNSECQEYYDAADLDCDDNNPDINPSATEIGCNLKDDDCNEETLDEEDRDEDGYTSCEECDDFDETVNPEATEVTCNGLDDDCDPSTPDAIDADNDGYSLCDADCDDEDALINPGMEETECNGVDDDCSETTPDGPDGDGDGVSECTDCDDDDVLNFPGNWEVCDDGQDNDCDTQIDEDCASDYSGTWVLDNQVFKECAEFFGVPVVSLNFIAVTVVDASPTIQVVAGGAQPGTMTGTFSSATEFSATRSISGSCTETYTISGTFTDPNTMEGTFTSNFSGGGNACKDCPDPPNSWSFTATR